jgi:hypothetical protein
VSANSDMVAPAVLITVAPIFANALLAAATAIADRAFAPGRARLGILRGPRGELLDPGSLSAPGPQRLGEDSGEVLGRRAADLVNTGALPYAEMFGGMSSQ